MIIRTADVIDDGGTRTHFRATDSELRFNRKTLSGQPQ